MANSPDSIPRRDFFKRGFQWGVLTSFFSNFIPAYSQKLSPLPVRPLSEPRRLAIVYDRRIATMPAVKYGLIGAVAGGLGGGFLTSMLHRRNFLHAVGSMIGGALSFLSYHNSRLVNALHSDTVGQFRSSIQDLSTLGYHVVVTDNSSEFIRHVKSASKRDAGSNTILLINAHGNNDSEHGSVIEGEPEFKVSELAKLSANVPGNVLVLANSCHFDASHFGKQKKKGRVSLLLLNSGDRHASSALGLPFYTAFRKGLRAENVVSGTLRASQELKDQVPAITRGVAKLDHSELKLFGEKSFRI